jgi:hypothetical protein
MSPRASIVDTTSEKIRRNHPGEVRNVRLVEVLRGNVEGVDCGVKHPFSGGLPVDLLEGHDVGVELLG